MFQYSYKSKNIKIHKYINIKNLNSKNLIQVLETSIHKKLNKVLETPKKKLVQTFKN
jgi:hypothetical protein